MKTKYFRYIAAAFWFTLLLLLALSFLWAMLLTGQASAQETTQPWSEAVNLSLSAGTSDPVLVVDSTGRAHALWREVTLDSFVYSSRVNGVWSSARVVELPFGTRRFYPNLIEGQRTPLHIPLLWAGRDDRVHATWLDVNGRLLYSNVSSAAFSNIDAWTSPQELSPSAKGAMAIADGSGRLHVAFIRASTTTQAPSGLYYVGSSNNGTTWSGPALLYESPYFRSLSSDQVNVQLASTAGGALLVAWDNPYQERVFVARSGNAGQSWEAPLEVDGRVQADGAAATGPGSIQIAAVGDQVLVVWQAGHDGLTCTPYYQVSFDGGVTWQPRERLLSRDETCADSNYLISGVGDVIFLASLTEDKAYMSAWDGTQWGDTQVREDKARFINPLNFREVALDCYQIANGASDADGNRDTAIVLGCDTGPGDDIWAFSVELDALAAEIAPQVAPVWQRPAVVGRIAGGDSLRLLADADGWLHALWVQPVSTDNPQRAVHYSRWDGIGWSQPRDLIRTPEGQDAARPAAVLSTNNKIMTVWTAGEPGSLYFSQANLAQAGNATEWSSPIILPMPTATASMPEIAVGQDGIIYVAYVVPLNEERGVYLTLSEDGGESWSDPERVFDAAAAGWAMVGDPQIAIGDEKAVHLMWTRSSSPPASEPQALFYSRSLDGGVEWAEPAEVSQSPGTWSDILASGELAAHRFWLAENNDLWHQFSGDGGATWRQPQRVSSSGDSLPIAASVFDGAGRPWLLQAAGTLTEQGGLRPPIEIRCWVMADSRWVAAETLTFGGGRIGGLAAAATSGGDMDVIFLASDLGGGADQVGETIYYGRRQLELPQAQPTPLPTLTPTPPAAATSTPTPAPMPTATRSFPTEAGESGGLPIPIDTSNPLAGPLLGAIPAIVVVLIAFFVGVRLMRGDGRR